MQAGSKAVAVRRSQKPNLEVIWGYPDAMTQEKQKGVWTCTAEDIAAHLRTDCKQGLNPDAVVQLRQSGEWNELPTTKPTSPWIILFRQFGSFLLWLLLIAASIAFLLGEWIEMQT